jgi:hypothetical protein
MNECHELEVIREAFSDLMLWILFLGGRGASIESKLYFTGEAAKILAAHDVFEEIDIKVGSQAFLWSIERENLTDRDSASQRSTKHSLLDVDTEELCMTYLSLRLT